MYGDSELCLLRFNKNILKKIPVSCIIPTKPSQKYIKKLKKFIFFKLPSRLLVRPWPDQDRLLRPCTIVVSALPRRPPICSIQQPCPDVEHGCQLLLFSSRHCFFYNLLSAFKSNFTLVVGGHYTSRKKHLYPANIPQVGHTTNKAHMWQLK